MQTMVMTPEFSRLSDSEAELMSKSPLLVCILIAGADGHIDNKEINTALTISREHHRVRSVLYRFFEDLSADFEDKLKILIQSYPVDAHQRTESITQELAKLNLLWPKVPVEFSRAYYSMLRDLALRIATSSGGIWGMRKISPEEERLLKLPMLVEP
jgi:hypothetical protein